MSKQIDITNTKPALPHEIKDVFVLNYDFDVSYTVKDDTSGNSWDSDTVNIDGRKFFTTEQEMNDYIENAKEYPNEEFDSYDAVDTRVEFSEIETDNSTVEKISLLEYFKQDYESCMRDLRSFLNDNPNYELVGDFKLVKRTDLKN
jgi:hypothetical protein